MEGGVEQGGAGCGAEVTLQICRPLTGFRRKVGPSPVAAPRPLKFYLLRFFFMSHRAVNRTWRLLSLAVQARVVASTLIVSQ